MTIQWGDTGRVRFGSLKTLNITPYVNEQNLTSASLPVGANSSAIPASPITTYTINTSTMAPTFSGINVLSYKSIFGINVCGQNTSGATQTVYYQINKNGSSYKTGNTSVVNNNYWTVSLFDGSLNNGDKLDVYVWTPASSGVNYFYQSVLCTPSRIDTGAKNVVNLSMTCVSLVNYLTLTGHATSGSASNVNIYTTSDTNTFIALSGAKTVNIPLANFNSTYKLFAIQNGDLQALNTISQTSTTYPSVANNWIVSALSYRELFY